VWAERRIENVKTYSGCKCGFKILLFKFSGRKLKRKYSNIQNVPKELYNFESL
jgi:hypothetical protein